MPCMDQYHFARIAYNAYCEKRQWKSVRGDPLPTFDAQSLELKEAWQAAADAVLKTPTV